MNENKNQKKIIITLLVILFILIIGILGFAKKTLDKETAVKHHLLNLSFNKTEAKTCSDFLSSLPEKIEHYSKESIKNNNVLYKSSIADQNPLEITCGINEPPQYKPTSQLQQIDGVDWFTFSDPKDVRDGLIYVTENRKLPVVIWIPADASTAPIQDFSQLVKKYDS